MSPSDPRIRNLQDEVDHKGYVLIWSTVLKDLIAFCRTTKDAERVPRGIVVYTAHELALLFPVETGGPGDAGLRLIHHAKKLGGGHVMEVEPTQVDECETS